MSGVGYHVRFAGLIAIVGLACLTRGHRRVVHKLEQVLAESSNDGELLAVLAEGIELVGESSLELLAGDVGELSLGDQGLSFGSDKLLLENHNAGAVGLLVLELGDLVRNFLLACGKRISRKS